MEWTDDTIARLRELWAEGHSTAEIGRRMGISKNAVVGKAHRLNLPARPSPIRRDTSEGAVRPQVARRANGPTLPALDEGTVAVVAVEAGNDDAPPPETAVETDVEPVTPSPVAAEAPAPLRSVATRVSRSHSCCWPLGEPGTRSFRFCDAEAMPGKPYCAEHASLAYVRVRDRRDEAA